LIVESAGELQITRVVPSQQTVTANQTENWTTAAWVKNIGGATIQVPKAPGDAALSFSQGATWNPILTNPGPFELSAGDSIGFLFNIDQSGDQTGWLKPSGKVARFSGIQWGSKAAASSDVRSVSPVPSALTTAGPCPP